MHSCVIIETTSEAWPLPCGLARQPSLRVACLNHTCISYHPSFYSDITIFYRLYGMSPGKSYGQGALRSRTASLVPIANSASIVQRLDHRALTGRALGITAHQHYGFRMHFEWNGAFGNRRFERRFSSYDSIAYFSTTLVNKAPEGLCSCILAREGSMTMADGCTGSRSICYIRRCSSAGGCSLISRRPGMGGDGRLGRKRSGRSVRRHRTHAVVASPIRRSSVTVKFYI